MSHAGHRREECSCGKLIMQCRCFHEKPDVAQAMTQYEVMP